MRDSQSLLLSEEGLFPLPDSNGLTSLGLPVAGTLQGEGMYAGVPSLFLRLAGCNMRCEWMGSTGATVRCDTLHAQTGRGASRVGVDEIVGRLLANRGAIDHLVITGGEPFLQAEALAVFLALLRAESRDRPFHVTVESNGSLFSEACVEHVDFLSISPKLPEVHSMQNLPLVGYIEALNAWLNCKWDSESLQLKFVVSRLEDERTIDEIFLSQLSRWDRYPVFLMPMGATREQMEQAIDACISICIRRNWRYSPRLHIDLWGSRLGV